MWETIQNLLIAMLSLMGLMVLVALGIFKRLGRIERRLAGPTHSVETGSKALEQALETSSTGAFEQFLREDPAREELPKSEQFAQFRQWRKEKGMNWSNS